MGLFQSAVGCFAYPNLNQIVAAIISFTTSLLQFRRRFITNVEKDPGGRCTHCELHRILWNTSAPSPMG